MIILQHFSIHTRPSLLRQSFQFFASLRILMSLHRFLQLIILCAISSNFRDGRRVYKICQILIGFSYFFLNFRDFYENVITKFECISKPYLITRVESSQKIAKQLRNKQSKTNYFLQTVTLQGKANPRLRASASARLGFYELGKNSVLAPRTLWKALPWLYRSRIY